MPTYRLNVGITYEGTGGPGVNVWHIRADNPEQASAEVVEALRLFYVACAGLYRTNTFVTCPDEMIGDPYGAPTYVPISGWQVQGASSGGGLPPANQLCVSWRTSSATRAGSGRTFLGPLASGIMDGDGTPTAAARAAVQAAADDLVAYSTGGLNGAVGVYSRTQNLLRDVVSARVRDQFAVLRSRRD